MQTTAIGTVAKSLPQNVPILLTLLIPKRYIPYTDLRKISRIALQNKERLNNNPIEKHLHVSILFSALTRMFPKPTFAP